MVMSGTYQPIPVIPPELTDIIIGYCREDKTLLASCSLVCKSWLPQSRYHLFSTVKINSKNLLGMLSLLDRPSSPIAPIVHQLELSDLRLVSTDWEEAIRRLAGLVGLRSLRLRLRSEDLSQMWAFVSSTFTSLTCLDLHDSGFKTFEEVAALLSAFPLVENLTISGDWDDHILPPPNAHRPPSHLRSLELICWSNDVLNWLALHEPIPCVQILVLHNIGMGEISAIREYLRATALTLQHLTLDFAEEEAKEVFCDNIDLSHNTELRFISIKGELTLIGDILSQIKSQHIEAVRAEVVTISSQVNALPWTHFDKVMGRPQFTYLQRLELQFEIWGDQDVVGDIQNRLPSTHARGILFLDERIPLHPTATHQWSTL